MKMQIKCLVFSVADRLNERSMKRFKTWIAASLLTFLAVAPTAWSASAQWTDITDPAELSDIMSNRTLVVTTQDGKPWNRSFNKSDGHGIASARGQEWARDWMIKEGEICINEHLGVTWEGIWLCGRWQRSATEKGLYRTSGSKFPHETTEIDIPKGMNIRVRPAPDYPKVKSAG